MLTIFLIFFVTYPVILWKIKPTYLHNIFHEIFFTEYLIQKRMWKPRRVKDEALFFAHGNLSSYLGYKKNTYSMQQFPLVLLHKVIKIKENVVTSEILRCFNFLIEGYLILSTIVESNSIISVNLIIRLCNRYNYCKN